MPNTGNIDQSYPQMLLANNNIKLLQPFSGAKVHHNMQCLTCSYEWTATPLSKTQAFKKYGVSGCPNCNKNRKQQKYDDARANNIQTLLERGIEVLDGWDGRRFYEDYRLVKVKNTKCGHIFKCSPANLLANKVECGVCGPTNRIAAATQWSRQNSEIWKLTATEWQKYKSKVYSLTATNYNNNRHIINPNNYPRALAGIDGAYHLDHIVPIRFCFDHEVPVEICASVDNLQMIPWRTNVSICDNIKGILPQFILKYLPHNDKIHRHGDILQSILPNSERFITIGSTVVTVYDKSSNRAIIVVPTSDVYADQRKLCINIIRDMQDNNVLYTILFEDELNDISLLKAKLLHYTKNNQGSRIHARKCIIKQCSNQEKRDLLNNNHVQGNDNSQIYYGAYCGDLLVAVMTFCAPRVAVGAKKQDEGVWELSRFCTDVNYRIPGIASKLLKHFQNNNSWKSIYSFADRRWSVGNMYTQLGFKQVAVNPPDYFYVVNGVRKHRWNYRKDVLKTKLENYDPSLTEYQNMVNHGYHRVWGAGTLKFEMKNSEIP